MFFLPSETLLLIRVCTLQAYQTPKQKKMKKESIANPSTGITSDQMKYLAAKNLDVAEQAVTAFNRKWRGLLSQEECRDLVGITYVKAVESAETFHPERASIRTWIGAIAHNAAYDYVQKKRLEVPTDFDTIDIFDADDRACTESPNWLTLSDRRTIAQLSQEDDSLTYEDRRRTKLQKECWRAAYSALSEREQVLLYMRYDLHKGGEEMAEELGLTHVALRVALSRAVDAFEAQLKLLHYKDIDDWTWRYFGEDDIADLDEEEEYFFGSRSEANG